MPPRGLLHSGTAAWSWANGGTRVDREFPKPGAFPANRQHRSWGGNQGGSEGAPRERKESTPSHCLNPA